MPGENKKNYYAGEWLLRTDPVERRFMISTAAEPCVATWTGTNTTTEEAEAMVQLMNAAHGAGTMTQQMWHLAYHCLERLPDTSTKNELKHMLPELLDFRYEAGNRKLGDPKWLVGFLFDSKHDADDYIANVDHECVDQSLIAVLENHGMWHKSFVEAKEHAAKLAAEKDRLDSAAKRGYQAFAEEYSEIHPTAKNTKVLKSFKHHKK